MKHNLVQADAWRMRMVGGLGRCNAVWCGMAWLCMAGSMRSTDLKRVTRTARRRKHLIGHTADTARLAHLLTRRVEPHNEVVRIRYLEIDAPPLPPLRASKAQESSNASRRVKRTVQIVEAVSSSGF